MQERTIEEMLVEPSMSIDRVMETIDTAGSGIAFVVNADGALLGTVTDGDIRRALLKHRDLSLPVEKVMNSDPTTIRSSWDSSEVYEHIDSEAIPANGRLTVPVVDSDGVVKDVKYIRGDDIPLFQINWNEEDIENAVESISRGSYWAKGPYVDKFESSIEDYLGVEHAVTVNSGTTALVTALKACGIGPGDEVIVPSFTFIATANSVRLAGAEPVFADIERQTYGLDPEAVENQITADTAAIMPVHVYGEPCQIEALVELAESYDLTLIEDAAAAMGAKFDGEFAGCFGEAGIFSFAQNKIITTGEGGVIITDHDSIADQARLFRSHGRSSEAYFDSSGTGDYSILGTNYRMADMNAAVGAAQLERIDDLIEKRQNKAAKLTERLTKIDHVTPPTTKNRRHVFQLYTFRLHDGVNRGEIINELEQSNISSKIYWDPVHTSEYYQDNPVNRSGKLEVTDEISETVLSLPFYPDISDAEIERIAEALRGAVGENK